MEEKEESGPFILRRDKKQAFDKRLIKEIVLLVEQGLPRRAAIEKYGMTKSTLGLWMTTYGSPAYHSDKKCTYPLSQRRSVLRAIEAGMTMSQAQIRFNIKSRTAIKRWMKADQQEKHDLAGCIVSPMPRTAKKKSKDEVKALQEALAYAQLKIKALDTMIDIAEEQLKIDIRKKSGAKQSEE
jgi:transposase